MYEKISEEEARLVKVRKVKNKILSEIDNRICSYKKLFAINEKTTEEDYNFFISENFALLELKKYLKSMKRVLRQQGRIAKKLKN